MRRRRNPILLVAFVVGAATAVSCAAPAPNSAATIGFSAAEPVMVSSKVSPASNPTAP
jgi:hypothetical protein